MEAIRQAIRTMENASHALTPKQRSTEQYSQFRHAYNYILTFQGIVVCAERGPVKASRTVSDAEWNAYFLPRGSK